MAELKERVGGRWQPSPGAIYPALLSLEELGLLSSRDEDGTRIYSLTGEGRRLAETASGAWAALAKRAQEAAPRASVGSILDAFASAQPERRSSSTPSSCEPSSGCSSGQAKRSPQH